MQYYGDFAEDATVYIPFNTFSSDDPQASVTITNLVAADIKVHKDGSVTQIVTDGATVAIDFDSITGNHLITIDTSAHADYSTGSDYMVRIEGTTVDAGTINAWVGSFSIENRTVATVRNLTNDLTKYGGPRGPGVYLNDAAANTSTTSYVDGIITNPVSTIAAAKTIADALSLDRIYLINDTAITLAATMADYEFVGIGAPHSNTIALASQSVDNSCFFNVTITGVQGGTERAQFTGCLIGTATLHCFAHECGFTDSVTGTTLSNDDDVVLDQCYSMVAGNATPIFICSGANLDAQFRHYSGGIELKTTNATAAISIETTGQVIFNADCNVNTAVTIRGFASITDNTGGMNSLTIDANWNRTAYAADGSTLTAIDLPNQTMDITGNLSGSVGSVVGHTAQTGDTFALANGTEGFVAIDAVVDAIKVVTDAIGTTGTGLSAIPWNAAWDAEVESEVNDAIDTAISELGVAAPTATPNLRTGLMLLYMALRNKTVVQTSGTDALEIYNDAGTKIASKALTDDGSDYTEAEMA